MYNPRSLVDISSPIDAPTVPRAATPGPEERLSHTFKSLFTLADVAARRRASRNIRNDVVTDENRHYADDAVDSSPFVNLRRSKSSGDVAVLGENSRALNAITGADNLRKHSAVAKVGKCGRGRAATTSLIMPSKIPKAKSPTPPNISIQEDYWSPPVAIPDITTKPKGLNVVDNAFFVMLTPPHTPVKKSTKNLTLAAHVPSLPKVASPFSPRTSEPWPRDQARPCARTSPGTGHTNASLHLTKSHWELRYEAWIRSLRTHRRPRSALSVTRPSSMVEEPTPRSRFPEPPTNPALFPRAGMLTPKALRHYSLASDNESRSALELDWALRAWPMDKIQRTLFVHDMDVRVWFPVTPSPAEKAKNDDPAETVHCDLDLQRMDTDEREKERSLRRWEWDWELRWKVMEGMVEDEHDKGREECEYDVFLAGESRDGDEAYGGCEVENPKGPQRTDKWDWSDDAVEIDASL